MHFTQQRLKTGLGFVLMPVQCFSLTPTTYKVACNNVFPQFHLLCCSGKIRESSHCNRDPPAQIVDPKGESFNCKKSYPILCGKLPALPLPLYLYIDLHVDSCYKYQHKVSKYPWDPTSPPEPVGLRFREHLWMLHPMRGQRARHFSWLSVKCVPQAVSSGTMCKLEP